MVERLNTILGEALDLYMGNNMGVTPEFIGPVIFGLLMNAEYMLSSNDGSFDGHQEMETLIAWGLLVLYIIFILFQFIKASCR